MPGWEDDIGSARRVSDLPKAAQDYVKRVGELVGASIYMVTVGPQRDAVIFP
jgi:adenylosuccinate synthase